MSAVFNYLKYYPPLAAVTGYTYIKLKITVIVIPQLALPIVFCKCLCLDKYVLRIRAEIILIVSYVGVCVFRNALFTHLFQKLPNFSDLLTQNKIFVK